jgi:hypothetical protein
VILRKVGLLALVASASLASAGSTARGGGPITLAVPNRANANVSIVADGAFVAAVWSAATAGGTTDVFAAVSRDGGDTFGPPVRVNSTPGDARVNGEQPPRVALAAAATGVPRIAVIWTSKTAAGTALLTSRSSDGGRTFTVAKLVPGTDAAGNRGWEAIGADPKGVIHAVWLDHRRMAAPDASRTAAAHQHGAHAEAGASAAQKPDGVAMAQRSDLYFDTLADEAPPKPIAPGVCYCCKTAIAFGRNGEIYLAWRHVYPGNFRDMAFSASTDGGSTFAPPLRVSQDNWMLEGCPDDGPAMRVDSQGRIHIVWPAVVDEHGTPVKALFHAYSTDGRSFSPRVRIPTAGHANHPQLDVAADGALVLAWDESGGGSRRIVHGRGVLDERGRASFSRAALSGETGVYPAIAAAQAGPLVAWTSGAPDRSVIRLTRLR